MVRDFITVADIGVEQKVCHRGNAVWLHLRPGRTLGSRPCDSMRFLELLSAMLALAGRQLLRWNPRTAVCACSFVACRVMCCASGEPSCTNVSAPSLGGARIEQEKKSRTQVKIIACIRAWMLPGDGQPQLDYSTGSRFDACHTYICKPYSHKTTANLL